MPKYPNDLGPTAICLAAAALIAVGGRIGRVGALFAASGRGSWLIAIGAAVLMTVSYAAARQMSQPPSDEMS